MQSFPLVPVLSSARNATRLLSASEVPALQMPGALAVSLVVLAQGRPGYWLNTIRLYCPFSESNGV